MIDETDEIDDDINDPAEHCRFLSLAKSIPRPVFRSFFEESIQQRGNTTISNRYSEVGDNQGVPINPFLTSNWDFF